MKRKVAGILALILGAVLFLSLGYSANLQDRTDHHMILVMITLVLWTGTATWFNLKSTVSSLIRVLILMVVSAAVVLWLK